MKIESSCTLEEYVEAHERLLARSNVARSWQSKNAVTGATVCGLAVFISMIALSGKPIILGLILGAIAAMLGGAISWTMHGNRVRQRLYDYYREQFGSRDSFSFELELTESGIKTNHLGTQMAVEWSNVEKIEETEDTIDFYTHNGGGLFMTKRYFSSPEEKQQFIEIAQGHLNKSRASSKWLHDS